MADSTLSLTYTGFRARIAHELGYGAGGSVSANTWDTEQTRQINDCLRSGLHKALFPMPAPGDKQSYRWRFLEPTRQLVTVASYSTGTITVVDGVVTGSGTTFPTWAADGDLIVNGVSYTVASYSSGTSITLDDTTLDVDAGTEYELARGAYTLDDDFGGLTEMTFVPEAGRRVPIAIVNEGIIRQLRSSNTLSYTGTPQYAAVRPKTSYASAGQRFEILLHPGADAIYRIEYKCHILPNAMASDEYPPGGAPYAEMFLASCLAVAEQRYKGGPGKHAADFAIQLKQAIDYDKRAIQAETLGPMNDFSDLRDDWRAHTPAHYRVVLE